MPLNDKEVSMQVGTPSGIGEGLATIQGSSANQTEQVTRQSQQQQETTLQENREPPPASGNIGQNINTTA